MKARNGPGQGQNSEPAKKQVKAPGAKNRTPDPMPMAAEQSPGAGFRILLAEDDPVIIQIMGTVITSKGYELAAGADGRLTKPLDIDKLFSTIEQYKTHG